MWVIMKGMHEGIVVDSWEVGDVDVKREKRHI